MTKNELHSLSKKYLIASSDLAGKLHDGKISAIALPAFENDLKYEHFAMHQDEDALYIQFFDVSGILIKQIKSHYTADDFIYVREPYWVDDGVIKYFSDFCPGNLFIKTKVTPGKFMKKINARTFLHIKSVSCRRLSDINSYELSKLGFKSILDFLDFYDYQLGEERYEKFRSYKNPYVFYYEFEVFSV